MRKIIKQTENPAKTLKAGEVLFEEGTAGNCFYIVRSGTIGIFKNYNNPNKVQFGSVGENRVLGEVAAIDGKPRSATAVALSDVTVVEISASAVKDQIKQCPTWLQMIILDLVDRLRHTADLLTKNGIPNTAVHTANKDMAAEASSEEPKQP